MHNTLPHHQPQGQDQAFLSRPPLSDSFLEALVAEIDTEQIRGIILGGSQARGDATPYSDVDVACFVADSRATITQAVSLSRGLPREYRTQDARRRSTAIDRPPPSALDRAWFSTSADLVR